MSFLLSLNPVGHNFSDYPYPRSNTLTSDSISAFNTQNYGCRGLYNDSFPAKAKATIHNKSKHLFVENVPPRPVRSTADLVETPKTPPLRKTKSQTLLTSSCYGTFEHPAEGQREDEFEDVSLTSKSDEQKFFDGFSSVAQLESTPIQESRFPNKFCDNPETFKSKLDVGSKTKPFQKWLGTLKRKAKWSLGEDFLASDLDRDHCGLSLPNQREYATDETIRPRTSASQSSSRGIITAVKSVTATLADTSLAPRSWAAGRLSIFRRSGLRRSADSCNAMIDPPLMDEMAWMRAIRRRKILEELVETEESYVADLRILANVYFTLLAHLSSISAPVRNSIRDNLSQIIQLHELLLGELHEAIPNSEYNQNHAKESPTFHSRGHIRWHSTDSTQGRVKDVRASRKLRHSIDISRPVRECPIGSIADPQTAAAVAKVFDKIMKRFFAYEEYGAKYEMMVKDLASTYKSVTAKQAYDRGIEVLSRTLASIKERELNGAKGLTVSDLVIKPIQRVCKYPLLFADLCKYTTVGDDPECHAEIEKVLFRLKETTREINKATDDPRMRDLIEKTWLLQDRLKFNVDSPRAIIARILGHIALCGVLHVAYQSKVGIKGQYMLCALFKSFLVLGVGDKTHSNFEVVASIAVIGVSLEDADNGRGLQCHSAPFSWKLVFESEHRLFELLMSACSREEESQWKKSINERISIETADVPDEQAQSQDFLCSLSLDLKPIGHLFGQAHTLARRISIHRTATVGPKTPMNQVIIRNTQSGDQGNSHCISSTAPIARSQSLLSSALIPVLSPRRSERIQMESALMDVWTRGVLPFPGMKPLRSDNPFRASAQSVIRKLSMASISSTFSWRSSSATERPAPPTVLTSNPVHPVSTTPASDINVPKTRYKRPTAVHTLPRISSNTSTSVKEPGTSPINFNDTPKMFLPPDFELPNLRKPGYRKKTQTTIRAVTSDCTGSKVPRPAQKISHTQLRKVSSMQTVACAAAAPATKYVCNGMKLQRPSQDVTKRMSLSLHESANIPRLDKLDYAHVGTENKSKANMQDCPIGENAGKLTGIPMRNPFTKRIKRFLM